MGMVNAPELGRIAERVRASLPGDSRAVLDRAVSRAAAGQVRVLVLGEAKRGKSTLVNALFERDLLPTGAVPVTSVATTVTVGSPVRAEVCYLDGQALPIGLDEVADLVSEQGNPSNAKRVDTVRITAPSPHLPTGTEVVDTPGTGSVHRANTDEAARARTTADLAVLVVAADPPVSAAELTLAGDVMTTAAAAAVVVSKIDLIRAADLGEVIEFTRSAVAGPLGADVPVFALSLRESVPTELVGWLGGRISRHGDHDVVGSTARALRREVSLVLDAVRIEHELLDRATQDSSALVAVLRDILDHARADAATATDHLHGQARRARARLDAAHEREVAAAKATARAELGSELPARPERPEAAADVVRERLEAVSAQQCAVWFGQAGAELDAALRTAAEQALSDLADDLADAREAAAQALDLQLSEVVAPAPAAPPRLPTLEPAREVVWRELLTSTVAGHLPAAVRRRRLHRHLRTWAENAVPQPFGRARSTLQRWLEDTTRTIERALAQTWREQIAALENGVREAALHRSDTEPERTARRVSLARELAVLTDALTDLDTLIDRVGRNDATAPFSSVRQP
jgi:GTPase SAR1 family protein